MYSLLLFSILGDMLLNVPNHPPSIASVRFIGLLLVQSLNMISHRSHVETPTAHDVSNELYLFPFALPLKIDLR